MRPKNNINLISTSKFKLSKIIPYTYNKFYPQNIKKL